MEFFARISVTLEQNTTHRECMRTLKFIRGIVCLGLILTLSACNTSSKHAAGIKKIYQQSAQYHLPDRNPVIVIPGILGSRLIDENSGTTVWGAFRANYAKPNTDNGRQLIALPIDTTFVSDNDHIHVEHESAHIEPDGVLENIKLNLAGFPVSIQAYAGILTTLGAGGYRDETLGLNTIDYGADHFTCFQFDYDWRRDLAYNAKKFEEFITAKRLYVQEQYAIRYGLSDVDVKFDVVAHSMGALLARYYLRYGGQPLPEDGTPPELTWAGGNNVERAILVAPPNAGSLEAFDQLVNGFNVGRPLLPYYPPSLLGTFPSVYQLLPRSRHKAVVWDGNEENVVNDLLDPQLWQKMEWGLASKDEETQDMLQSLLPYAEGNKARHEIALKYQADALTRAKQFQTAIDLPAKPPNGVDLYLVAGDATEAIEVMSIDSQSGDISVLRKGIGDKTVLRSSALMDERVNGEWEPFLQAPIEWSSVLFVPAQHREITSDPVFENNVLYWLLEEPRADSP